MYVCMYVYVEVYVLYVYVYVCVCLCVLFDSQRHVHACLNLCASVCLCV